MPRICLPISRTPAVFSTSYSEKSLREVVGVLREGDRDKAGIRAKLHEFTKKLNDVGLKVKKYPWGITVDGRHLSEEEWKACRAARPDLDDSFGALP